MVDLDHKRPQHGEGGNAAHAHEAITAYALTVQFQKGAMGYIPVC